MDTLLETDLVADVPTYVLEVPKTRLASERPYLRPFLPRFIREINAIH